MTDFEKALKALKKMSDDIDALELKYGKTAKWVVEKRDTLQTILNFYDDVIDELDEKDHIIELMTVNYKAMNMILYQKEMALPWAKVGLATGQKLFDTPELIEIIEKDLEKLISTDG